MKYFAKISQKEYELELKRSHEGIALLLNGKPKHAELKRIGESSLFSLIVDNRSYQLFIEEATGGYSVSVEGDKHFVELEDEKARFIRSLTKSDEKEKSLTEIKAPMPGLIVSVTVSEGQKIKKGERLIIIEAMKMENEIRANGDGTVKKVLVKEKESVEKDGVLLVLE